MESFSTVNGEGFFKELHLSTSNEDICFGEHLSKLRKENIGRLILVHVKINSIRYKFDQLVYGVKGKVDVLIITKTKLDDSFPIMQVTIEGHYKDITLH